MINISPLPDSSATVETGSSLNGIKDLSRAWGHRAWGQVSHSNISGFQGHDLDSLSPDSFGLHFALQTFRTRCFPAISPADQAAS